jgi:hypothetical protein
VEAGFPKRSCSTKERANRFNLKRLARRERAGAKDDVVRASAAFTRAAGGEIRLSPPYVSDGLILTILTRAVREREA